MLIALIVAIFKKFILIKVQRKHTISLLFDYVVPGKIIEVFQIFTSYLARDSNHELGEYLSSLFLGQPHFWRGKELSHLSSEF